MKKYLLLTCIALLVANTANAQFRQHDDYVGGGFVSGDLNFSGLDFGLNAIDLKLGVEMQPWLHLEGRVAFGVNDKGIGGIEVSINRLLGAHGVLSYPNDSRFQPYVLAGITYGEVEFRLPGIARTDESESGLSLGAGIDFELNDSLDLYLEYMQYLDKGDVDYGAFTLGIKFGL